MRFWISLTLACALLPACLAQNKLIEQMEYPALDQHPMIGVIHRPYSALGYDPYIDYKVMIDIQDGQKNKKDMSFVLREVGRTYNLHLANGVPPNKLDMRVIIHGSAVSVALNNEAYQARYHTPNPNIELIQALAKLNVKFYLCSQSLAFQQLEPEELLEPIELVLSAKTALTTLDLMNYSYLFIGNKE